MWAKETIFIKKPDLNYKFNEGPLRQRARANEDWYGLGVGGGKGGIDDPQKRNYSTNFVSSR